VKAEIFYRSSGDLKKSKIKVYHSYVSLDCQEIPDAVSHTNARKSENSSPRRFTHKEHIPIPLLWIYQQYTR
jgi:hypothetical protein